MIDSRVHIVHSFLDKQMLKVYLSSDMHVGSQSFDERGGMRPTSQKLYMVELDGTEKSIRTIGFHI